MWMGGTRKITSEREEGRRVAIRAGYRVLCTRIALRPFRPGLPAPSAPEECLCAPERIRPRTDFRRSTITWD